jgi:hypothetical protein
MPCFCAQGYQSLQTRTAGKVEPESLQAVVQVVGGEDEIVALLPPGLLEEVVAQVPGRHLRGNAAFRRNFGGRKIRFVIGQLVGSCMSAHKSRISN